LARTSLGGTLLDSHRFAQAIAELQAVLGAPPEERLALGPEILSSVHRDLAQALRLSGQAEQALPHLRRSHELRTRIPHPPAGRPRRRHQEDRTPRPDGPASPPPPPSEKPTGRLSSADSFGS
jgi:hypothetical protein